MPTTAKAKAAAQQSVIVHVHTAPARKTRRRAPKRAQAPQRGASASNAPVFGIPSMSNGGFYIHPPTPFPFMPSLGRLAPETVQASPLAAEKVANTHPPKQFVEPSSFGSASASHDSSSVTPSDFESEKGAQPYIPPPFVPRPFVSIPFVPPPLPSQPSSSPRRQTC